MNTIRRFSSVIVIASLLAGMGLAASCGQPVTPERTEIRESVSFVVKGSVPTRADATDGEDRVVSLDVLAFRSDNGMLDAHARTEAEENKTVTEVFVTVSKNVDLDWFVVANAPAGAFSAYSSKTAFLSGVTALGDGFRSSLVMMGSGVLPASGLSQENVAVTLNRYPCKVSIEKITVDWPDAYVLGSVMLGRIALVNVVGTTPWSASPAAGDVWYNRGGLESVPAAVSGKVVRNYGGAFVPSGESYDADCSLYCMPNPVANGENATSNPTWAPRNTRLSVELLFSGQSNWYPIDLPAMECNKHYLVRQLTIKGPGSAGPDIPVQRTDIRFTVLVTDWQDESITLTYGD